MKLEPDRCKKSLTVLDCFMIGALIAGVALILVPFSFEQVQFGFLMVSLWVGYFA